LTNLDKEKLIYSLKIDTEKRAQKRTAWSRKKKTVAALATFGLIFAVYAINEFFKAPSVQVVRAEVIQEGLPEIVLTAGGYVEADSTILVSSQLNGKIQNLLVDEGKVVKKGDVLAEIEDTDYRAKHHMAQADFELAEATFRRKNTLYKEGVISRAEYDEAAKVYGVAKGQLESAKYNLDNTLVRAPIDGTVIKKEKEVGEFLLPGITSEGVPGSAILKIADLRIMNVEMDILEADLPKIKMDAPSMVFPDALPDQSFAAKVFYIAPQADRQKSIVLVKVRIENPDSQLKPEMSARVYFLKEKAQKEVMRRVSVPASAVFQKDHADYVYIVQKDELVLKKVGVASKKEGEAFLSSGLAGDESVVVFPKYRYRAGMKVAVKSVPSS
jgi:RND family efflux transporter MFP subunit